MDMITTVIDNLKYHKNNNSNSNNNGNEEGFSPLTHIYVHCCIYRFIYLYVCICGNGGRERSTNKTIFQSFAFLIINFGTKKNYLTSKKESLFFFYTGSECHYFLYTVIVTTSLRIYLLQQIIIIISLIRMTQNISEIQCFSVKCRQLIAST